VKLLISTTELSADNTVLLSWCIFEAPQAFRSMPSASIGHYGCFLRVCLSQAWTSGLVVDLQACKPVLPSPKYITV
jgi:hypothetical protein